jgi:nicotinamide-nucleotide amidase
MICKQLIIGNEILSGRTRDKNISILASQMATIGIKVDQVMVIQDDKKHIKEALDYLKSSSDLIFITGGLGPTEDDITKNTLAEYFNSPLTFSKGAEELVTTHYERKNIKWNRDVIKYDYIPQDATPLFNPAGLAPGLYFEQNEKIFISAPGVPREFKGMLTESIIPLLKEKFHFHSKIQKFTIRTRFIPEEKIFFNLYPNLWDDLAQFGNPASLPHSSGVDLVIYNYNPEDKDKIISLMENGPLKEYIWQYGDMELNEYVVKKAIEKNLTISTAESCTGGLIASQITDVSGSSQTFLGSVVCYDNDVKTDVLKVSKNEMIQHGAVDGSVASQMAENCRKLIKSDLAVSITGIAGPGGGSKEKPVGLAYFGISSKIGTASKRLQFSGDREYLKSKFTMTALFTLLDEINKL